MVAAGVVVLVVLELLEVPVALVVVGFAEADVLLLFPVGFVVAEVVLLGDDPDDVEVEALLLGFAVAEGAVAEADGVGPAEGASFPFSASKIEI